MPSRQFRASFSVLLGVFLVACAEAGPSKPESNPIPQLVRTEPAALAMGSPDQSIVLVGAGFVSGSIARWNGDKRPTTFVNATRLELSLTQVDVASAGVAHITVENPTPGGGASPSVDFSVLSPAPTVTAILPTTVIAGSAAVLTVSGTNFFSGTQLLLNGSRHPATVVNSSTLRADLSASDLSTAGPVAITVFNPGPGGGSAEAVPLKVNAPMTLSGLAPSSVVAGGAGFTLTVTGSGFAPRLTVLWENQPRPTTYVNPTTLTANIPALDFQSAFNAKVEVTDFGTGALSNALRLTIVDPPPISISGISPSSVPAGSAPFVLRVSGTNFTPRSIIRWDDVDRATTYESPTSLTMTTTIGDVFTAGTHTVAVRPSAGAFTRSLTFTVSPVQVPPVLVSGMTPDSRPAGSANFQLSVSGINLTGVTVFWNGAARPTSQFTGSQVFAAIPASDLLTAGTANISVRNTATGAVSGSIPFYITSPPVGPDPQLATVSPGIAPFGANGLTVTVQGANFLPGMLVQLSGGGRPTTYVDGGTLTATLSAADLSTERIWSMNVRNTATSQVSASLPFAVSKFLGPTFPAPAGLWQPPANVIPATGNFVYLDSDPGDYIGQSATQLLTTPFAVLQQLSGSALTMNLSLGGWHADFATLAGMGEFKPGYYGNAARYPFNSTSPGLDWSGNGRGCNTVSGWFVIDNVTYSGPTLTSVTLRFEQQCEGVEPPLHGAIRWAK